MRVRRDSTRRRARGFTLLELLIVVVVILVLLMLSIPAYRVFLNKARVTVAEMAMDEMHGELMLFQVDHMRFPAQPIDFSTGTDGDGRRVFSSSLLSRIGTDLTAPVYIAPDDGSTYTVQANANDSNQTSLMLMPTSSPVSKGV